LDKPRAIYPTTASLTNSAEDLKRSFNPAAVMTKAFNIIAWNYQKYIIIPKYFNAVNLAVSLPTILAQS